MPAPLTPAAIAFNRFGLGARPLDRAPGTGEARRWVLGQLDRYDFRPAALAGVPNSAQAIATLADAYEARQTFKLMQREAQLPIIPSAAGPAMADMAGAPPASMAGLAPSLLAPTAPRPTPPAGKVGANNDAFRAVRLAYIDAIGARSDAALVSDTPFAERLVHFWSNHFALSVDKQEVIGLAGTFEVEAIRPHILGKFSDMLLAVESHPAMLLYLDQAQSIGPNSPAAARAAPRLQAGLNSPPKARRGLNENLAREIMELHTLGVRSGYTQADVTEFARALTGWTVAGIRRVGALQGLPAGFVFADRFHEPGPRRILGRNYGEEGEAQARAVLADLAVNPATAAHIATKLACHFTADNPPPALVARLTHAFLASGGDLPTVYRALIAADEPWNPADGKFRTPWLWGIAALRACGTDQLPPRIAFGLFDQLGQQIWKPGSPAGYDDTSASWAAPDALLRRVEAAGRIAAQATGTLDARVLADQLFPGCVSAATRTAIARAESPAQALALLLVAPEMMRS